MSTTTPAPVRFSIKQVPFSRRGAYLSITNDHWTEPIGRAPYLKSVHGKLGTPRELFRLDLTQRGRAVASSDAARPGTGGVSRNARSPRCSTSSGPASGSSASGGPTRA